jgi:hypothetical protein
MQEPEEDNLQKPEKIIIRAVWNATKRGTVKNWGK